MNNKLNNIINDFLANTDAKDEKELNRQLNELIQKYNNGEIECENTILDDANEILEKATNAKTKKQALKYAKQAYEMCPACFDAILFQANLEEHPLKRWNLLIKGLEAEEERLKKEGYFDKDNIGYFYGIFETRPYIRGLLRKASYLICDGKFKQACKVCKEILKLNKSDNMGVRYLLMAIYAYFEDENSMQKLYQKYPEENLEMLFPLFILYYKQENDDKAREYLNRINKVNSHFIKFFRGTMKEDDNAPQGYYSRGDSSEVIMYFNEYGFLIDTVPNIEYYILENSKQKK